MRRNYVRATIHADRNSHREAVSVYRWLGRWEEQCLSCFEAVHPTGKIYDVVAPEEALAELPRSVVLSR